MRERDFYDPFKNMPLKLMMLVEVRPTALKNYGEMSEDERIRADAAARSAKDRAEKERIIDMIERGEAF